jgi:hypothetical protein
MSSRKRTAQEAAMDPPDQQSTTKKPKLVAALEARLTKLKKTLHPDELRLEWTDYDPRYFMESMRSMSRRICALTLKSVEEYINNGGLEADLNELDIQESNIQEVLNSEGPHLARATRQLMIDYVAEVRTRLNGQS